MDKKTPMQKRNEDFKSQQHAQKMNIDHLSSTVSLRQLQQAVGEWSEELFGDNDHNFSKVTGHPMGSANALTGLVEEVGELNHVVICQHQGRRGYDDPEKALADKKDAIGDIMVFLSDFCCREGIDIHECFESTWRNVVSKRNLQNWEQVSHDSPVEQCEFDNSKPSDLYRKIRDDALDRLAKASDDGVHSVEEKEDDA